ncbi:hypothetical protein RCO28_09390 [Streptomyces sp. LHD-70]|uniref:hypothetical protein n=1 Tax=Streptomyces sp. LHD-70 TaxID=3072140 RepID=UPI00281045B1|nr:hypothetical protein [Streptomyces sp. LHD-70]MDQ8702700.1 hypothetical protein [Streptomyces sp. LHD-70]
MSNSQPQAAAPALGPDAADTRIGLAWVGPLLSTAVTLPLAFFAHFLVVLGASAVEDHSGSPASLPIGIFRYGLLVPFCLLWIAWALVRHPGLSHRRVLCSVVAPVSVLLLTVAVLAFMG